MHGKLTIHSRPPQPAAPADEPASPASAPARETTVAIAALLETLLLLGGLAWAIRANGGAPRLPQILAISAAALLAAALFAVAAALRSRR